MGVIEGEKRGKEIGKEIGKQEGLLEGKKEVAKKLLEKGLPIKDISELTGLTENEINQMK